MGKSGVKGGVIVYEDYMDYRLNQQILLKKWVVGRECARMGERTTVICLHLSTGIEIVASHESEPDCYDFESGVLLATMNGLKQVEKLYGSIDADPFNYE